MEGKGHKQKLTLIKFMGRKSTPKTAMIFMMRLSMAVLCATSKLFCAMIWLILVSFWAMMLAV